MGDRKQNRQKSSPAKRSIRTQRQVETFSTEQNTLNLILKKFEIFEQRLVDIEKRCITSNPDSGTSDNAAMEITQVSASTSTTSERPNIMMVNPLNVNKPTFNGTDGANPIKFLKRLRQYITTVGAEHNSLNIATEAITGTAKTLLEVNSDRWTSLEDFERDFRTVFWNERQQEIVKHKFFNSLFDRNRNWSMSEYFATQVEMTKHLTIPLSESEIVNAVFRQFPTEIQTPWFTRNGPATIISGAEFLRNVELNVICRNPITHQRAVTDQQRKEPRNNNYRRVVVNTIRTSFRGRRGFYNRRSRRGAGPARHAYFPSRPAIAFQNGEEKNLNTETPTNNSPSTSKN